jgi:hypothetical protein
MKNFKTIIRFSLNAVAVVCNLALIIPAVPARAQEIKAPMNKLTSGRSLEILFGIVEKRIIELADAMPANKYHFIPANGEFNDVRTFGEQLKHLAATNFILGATALQEPIPLSAGDEMGPDTVRTKPEIIAYVKASFGKLHKAMDAIDDKYQVIKSTPISPLHEKTTRLGLVVESLIHAYDHYGQMVVYARMNLVIPPSSR